ncbi:OprD family outer membrane porin [Endozoicomonadaceae bacterium StTr2]
MKKITTGALSAAIMAGCLSSGAQADQLSTLFDESQLDLKLRNAYFNNDGKHVQKGQTKRRVRQWGQGIQLDYTSGYMWDVLGFDVSWYSGLKLDGGKGNTNTDLLYKTDSGKMQDYSKIGVANIKARFGDDDVNMLIRGGRLTQDNPIMASSGSRLTPSSFEGGSVEADFYGYDVYYSYLTKQSERNKNGFEKFVSKKKDASGKEMELCDVKILGFKHEFDMGLGFEFAYGEAKDYKKRSSNEVYYVHEFEPGVSLKLDGQYHWMEGNTKKKYDLGYASFGKPEDQAKYAKGKNYESRLYNLNAELVYQQLTAAVSYTQTKDGFFDYYMHNQDHGTGTFWTSRTISDFNHENEKVWQASVAYDFMQYLPGFKAALTYTHGEDAYNRPTKKDDGKEWERDVVLSYDFQQPALKGLAFSYEYSVYRNNNNGSTQKALEGNSRDDHRVYLDYTVALF